MKYDLAPLIRLGQLAIATLVILLGGIILLEMLRFFLFEITSQLFDFELIRQSFAIITIASAFLVGYSSGIFSDSTISIQQFFNRDRYRRKVTATTSHRIEVANFEFKLDDPQHTEQFDLFLDQVHFITGTKRYVTPAQLVEEVALQIVAEIEQKYRGELQADTKIVRGSLLLTIGVYAFTAYQILANYHDVIESLEVLKNQAQSAFNRITQAYKQKTDNDARLTSQVEVAPKPTIESATANQSSALPPASPISVNNSIGASPPGRDVSVSVNMGGRNQGIIGCLTTCSLISLVMVVSFAAFLALFVDYQTRLRILDASFIGLADILRTIGDGAFVLADTLAPR